MGGGTWTANAYEIHSTTTRGFASMDEFNAANAQELYRSTKLDAILNPYNITRECCDSEEHPNTIPVILALDVTGSMGSAAEAIAKQLNDIMDELYKKVTDVEFCIMAIGDLSYDMAPIQMGQFESDIRIAEQLEKVFFEKGGGGNFWESYTAAWYMGLYHTKLDCWKRGKKGIIITIGDEPLNPYLPSRILHSVTGDSVQGDVDTNKLYDEVSKKYDIYHIGINDDRTCFSRYKHDIQKTFGKILGENYKESDCQNLYKTIAEIIENSSCDNTNNINDNILENEGGIYW